MNRSLMLCFLASFLFACNNKSARTVAGFEGKPLPSFDLLLMDSIKIINTENLPNGKSTVLFYFNPHCPYCKAQTNQIIEEIKGLKDIQFCFLSDYPFTQVKQYFEQFHLNKYPNITVGQDYNAYFAHYIKALGAPYSAVYGSDKRLKQLFMGKTDVREIKHIALN